MIAARMRRNGAAMPEQHDDAGRFQMKITVWLAAALALLLPMLSLPVDSRHSPPVPSI